MNHQIKLNVKIPVDVTNRKISDEVCMVVLWKSKILLVTKAVYPIPEKMYRLPTGGVEKGEYAIDALHRETWEELNTKFENIENLGIIRFNLVSDNTSKSFNSHIYLLKTNTEIKMEKDQEHSAHLWVDAINIPKYINMLNTISTSNDIPGYEWSSWGKLRASTLDYVYKTLVTKKYLLSA